MNTRIIVKDLFGWFLIVISIEIMLLPKIHHKEAPTFSIIHSRTTMADSLDPSSSGSKKESREDKGSQWKEHSLQEPILLLGASCLGKNMGHKQMCWMLHIEKSRSFYRQGAISKCVKLYWIKVLKNCMGHTD